MTFARYGYLLAFGAGISFVMQQAVNTNLRTAIGSPWWAGFVSYLGGTLVMLAVAVALREPLPSPATMQRADLISWSGGFFGAIYIAVSILLLPTPAGRCDCCLPHRRRADDRLAGVRSVRSIRFAGS